MLTFAGAQLQSAWPPEGRLSQARWRGVWERHREFRKVTPGKNTGLLPGRRFGQSTVSFTAQAAATSSGTCVVLGAVCLRGPCWVARDTGGTHERPKGRHTQRTPQTECQVGRRDAHPGGWGRASWKRGPRTGPGRKGRTWTGEMSLLGTTNSRNSRCPGRGGGRCGPLRNCSIP